MLLTAVDNCHVGRSAGVDPFVAVEHEGVAGFAADELRDSGDRDGVAYSDAAVGDVEPRRGDLDIDRAAALTDDEGLVVAGAADEFAAGDHAAAGYPQRAGGADRQFLGDAAHGDAAADEKLAVRQFAAVFDDYRTRVAARFLRTGLQKFADDSAADGELFNISHDLTSRLFYTRFTR